ncbi:uncharacterized protein L969DRAFT_86443 [Mixia osmundae IAM 14324]|uniref:uncharacterized protein n=1 Tax=Mixia osmundae (strain CBS 9802 / IAM 14324 / JCM 22182 / KY 12970) TaxID=764103 RepID=UPI0004A552A7|nr:uncharacterized protein L969DRAFT_86443 [Mixia osmundae IAM 14324]KEI39849.1 hypothetical protein L969DRAFT_86443 [Mixia osmundae IAM 14324]
MAAKVGLISMAILVASFACGAQAGRWHDQTGSDCFTCYTGTECCPGTPSWDHCDC